MYEICVKNQLELTSIVSQRVLLFPLLFSLLLSHFLSHDCCSDAEIEHKGCVEPRSDGDLCLEGLRADTVLKVVNLQTATRECPFGVN
jgi:hypothetical protein